MRGLGGALRGAAIGAAALAAGACGERAAGEIVVVVGTDLAAPKDIDEISLAVDELRSGAGGAVPALAEARYPIAVATGGVVRLPTTLALVAGDDPTVEVVVTARALRAGEARVTRVARTRIPRDRAAMLRLPLSFLCTAGSGAPEEACHTTVETALTVEDPAALPAYDPAEVFGGGAGPGEGACFDTTACLRGAEPAAVDPEGCTLEVGPGVTNVALETEGEGVCGPEGCFVPLDVGGELGWTRAPSGEIRLPAAACALLGRTALGVRVSAACPPKTAALPLCGAWSATGGRGAEPGEGEPVVLAGGQDHPVDLALDALGARVFWVSRGSADDGEVKVIPTGGGAIGRLASGRAGLAGVAFAAGRVAWTGRAGVEVCDPEPGGACALLDATHGGGGVAGWSSTWCWTEWLADGRVHCAGGPQGFDAYLHRYPFRIASGDEGRLWVWTDEGTPPAHEDGVVWAAVRDAAKIPTWYLQRVTPDPERWPRYVVVQGATVAWTSLGDGSAGAVRTAAAPRLPEGARCAGDAECCSSNCVNGSCSGACEAPAKPVTFAAGGLPDGLAADGEALFWGDLGTNEVRTAKLPDGAPVRLARARRPGAVAVDARAVYWVEQGAGGRLVKMRRP